MAGQKKLTVVISQHQGKNPVKRQLEEELAMACMMDPEVEVSIVPNLYDLSSDHSGMLFLSGIRGDVVVLSWLYPRATQWILDRSGIKGKAGTVLLVSDDEEEDDEASTATERPNAIGTLDVPNRLIYCVDLRASPDPREFLGEIRRIVQETSTETVDLLSWIQGEPKKEQLERYLNPQEMLGIGHSETGAIAEVEAEEKVRRRWYPVIDYDRCTNCMECIDFCLFGVYGVDSLDRILVESQDSCKKGCPACSRVCPENAIVFPQHKTPAIAGAAGEVAGLKIDLSQLFGGGDAMELAARERDIELVRDGRDAVGMEVGIPKRQPQTCGVRDELDDLIDGLDDLDL
ncbi:MAG: ferredoxin family protein [Planctomycetota bacterium]|nr:ferredoxin family protein [Planctomycetota bacterium]MDA1165441.1 ferredoxin family protein [Planctomycetota bacterium]